MAHTSVRPGQKAGLCGRTGPIMAQHQRLLRTQPFQPAALAKQPKRAGSLAAAAAPKERISAPVGTNAPKQQLGEQLKELGKKAAACVGATAMAAALVLPGGMLAPPAADSITTEQLLFLEGWRAIDRAYFDKSFNGQPWFRKREELLKKEKFDSREDTYAALNKLLALLDDPFTRHLPPERLTALRRGTAGSVTGIGVEITLDESQGAAAELVVVAPTEGGPADRAGIKAGDVIPSIAGKSTRGMSLYEASDLLLGPVDSEVVLTVRHGKEAPREVVVRRDKLAIKPVTYDLCTGAAAQRLGLPAASKEEGNAKVGYVRIKTFNTNTVPAVIEALQDAKASGADGLVLDLRNNGGGLFPAGVQVGKMLIKTGDIVLIADSQGVRDIYSADNTALDATTPLSVWVNRGTASASEVLAGALKDNKRGTIVGETTFGKGLIQTVIDLSDGSGLAVTVARYQTPAGLDINRIGIKPNIAMPSDTLPLTGDGVCKLLASDTAPRIYG